MALNIKNDEVEFLVAEVSRITGETKTEAVRRSLAERRERLIYRLAETDRKARIRRFLETELWPSVPAKELGRRLSRTEEDDILGFKIDGT